MFAWGRGVHDRQARDLLAHAPGGSQGRKAIWTAINPHSGKRRIDEAFPLELRANTNEQEMFIRLKNGATWQVVGSDRYDAAVGLLACRHHVFRVGVEQSFQRGPISRQS